MTLLAQSSVQTQELAVARTIKVKGNFYAYDGARKGVSLQMSAVQIIDLVEHGGGSQFDAVKAAALTQLKGVMATTTTSKVGIIKGFRSGLEERISRQIEEAGLQCIYEADKFHITGLKGNLPTALIFGCQKMAAFFMSKPKDASLSATGRSICSSKNNAQTSTYVSCSATRIASSTKAQRRATHNGAKSMAFVCTQTIPDDWLQCEGDKGNEPESKDMTHLRDVGSISWVRQTICIVCVHYPDASKTCVMQDTQSSANGALTS